MSDWDKTFDDDSGALEQEDTLSQQEEAAIVGFAVILTDTQIEAVLHFFANELARRQGVTGQTTMNIPINGMIVLPGGRL